MGVVLVGANPGVLLRDSGIVTAFASLWVVEWSERGSGRALVLWHDGRVRLVGPDPALSGWLAETFVRHFGEVAGLPWAPMSERADVEVDLDLTGGLSASAADVTLSVGDVLDRRVFAQDGLTLGGRSYDLSNVVAPCGTARITVGGTAVPGRPDVDSAAAEPSSSAFLAVAEVWTTR